VRSHDADDGDDDDDADFDLEGRLDGVVESTEARGIIGTSRALLAYVLKVYLNDRNLWQNAVEDMWLIGRGSFFNAFLALISL
jgi:hypothetical protein